MKSISAYKQSSSFFAKSYSLETKKPNDFYNREVFGFKLSEWSLHVLPVPVWVSSACFGLLLQSKGMQIRLAGDSKLPMGLKVSMNG